METFFVEKFIDKIVTGGEGHPERFYKIFSARGFLLDFNQSSGQVRLSSESHPEDGKYNQFRECTPIPKIRVYDLEPFIARLVKSVSSIGISTWSSCEGHLEESAYIKFDGKYHRLWFQTIFDTFIKKRVRLVCHWDWLGWDERCFISSANKSKLESYLEIQDVARFIYDNRILLWESKNGYAHFSPIPIKR